MATVNSLASSGYSSSSSSYTSLQKELSDAKKEYADLSKNKNLTSEERTSLQKEYKDKISAINDKITVAEDETFASVSGNSSSLLGGNADTFSLFGNTVNSQSGFDFFFGAQNTLSSLSIVNKARQSIESRARTLTSEIKMDKMRGISTAGKEEALANLTANVTLMDDNLSNNVNKALESDKTSDKKYTPIITKIKDNLDAEQKKLDTEFKEYQASANKKNGVTEAEDK